jgi:hypothetical protein
VTRPEMCSVSISNEIVEAVNENADHRFRYYEEYCATGLMIR